MKTSSEQQTKNIGKNTASESSGGDILLLQGELGAGKTTFTKGFCNYFGIEESNVRSPTFTLINVYPANKNTQQAEQIVHIDTYRMEHEQDLVDIGVEEYLDDPDSIVIIEWPEKIESLIKDKDTKTIEFKHIDKNEREIKIS